MYVRTERQLTYRFQPPGPACWTAGISTTPNNSALLEFLVTKRNMQYCKTFNRTEGTFIEATPRTLVPFHDLPTRWLGRCLKTLYVQTSTYLQHKKTTFIISNLTFLQTSRIDLFLHNSQPQLIWFYQDWTHRDVLRTSWNVMAHAQKPRFHLSAKRTSPFKSAGDVSSVDCWQPEVCASAVVMLDTPCSEVVWRVLVTH